MKYKVEVHVEQIIEAANEDQAAEIAESLVCNNTHLEEVEEKQNG